MKRFLVFTGDIYYAKGGFKDFYQSYDTLAEAVAACSSFNSLNYEWSHVVDSVTWEIEWRSK